MFWENFIDLCVRNNTKPNPVAKKIGISSGTVTKWKNGCIPNDTTLKKLANYFNVSVDYLLGGSDKMKYNIDSNNSKNNIKPIKDWGCDPSFMNSPHIIAYIDVLGTKDKLENSEISEYVYISQLEKFYHIAYNTILNTQSYQHNGVIHQLPSFKVKMFSDNIVIAKEYNESSFLDDFHSLVCVISLLQSRALYDMELLIRGSITIGNLYIDDIFLLGTGLVETYTLESKNAFFPRIVLSKSLMNEFDKSSHNAKDILKKAITSDVDYMCYINYLHFLNKDEIIENLRILEKMYFKSKKTDVTQKISWCINLYRKNLRTQYGMNLNIPVDDTEVAAWRIDGNEGGLPHPVGDDN